MFSVISIGGSEDAENMDACIKCPYQSSLSPQRLSRQTSLFPDAHKLSLRPTSSTIRPLSKGTTDLKAECGVNHDSLGSCIEVCDRRELFRTWTTHVDFIPTVDDQGTERGPSW